MKGFQDDVAMIDPSMLRHANMSFWQ